MVRTRGHLVFLLIALCVLSPIQSYAQERDVPLSITVIEGDRGIIDGIHKVDIVVRVSAVGADVTFKLPAGTGASFPGGASQISIQSDAQGLARSGMLTASSKGGEFDVKVEATYLGQTANALVHETNAMTAPAVSPGHKSHALMWVVIAGAGAAGGALAAMKKGGSSGSGASSSVSVTVGNPSVGSPQ